MKSKNTRRIEALNRFSIQSETEWNNGVKGDKQVEGTYDEYVTRKQTEKSALEKSIVKGVK